MREIDRTPDPQLFSTPRLGKGFRAVTLIRNAILFVLLVFLLPAMATVGWWVLQDRPTSWRQADWSASGLLPGAGETADAALYIMAARTGGLKGAFSVHSWVVVKRPGSAAYERYDKVGWGSPIRRNGYAADARWYSNLPEIVCAARGEAAEALIPAVDRAIADYPFARAGDYRIWPGPNSNSFVAHVARAVPQLGSCLPPNATGRDFAPGIAALEWDGRNLRATLGGYAGFAAGLTDGLELHFMGLVAGIDLRHPALKVPAYGRVPLAPAEAHAY